jgi:hypothetical protein
MTNSYFTQRSRMDPVAVARITDRKIVESTPTFAMCHAEHNHESAHS